MIKRLGLALAAALAVAVAAPSFGQPAGAFQAVTPLTRDLGNIRSLTAATANTYVSQDQSGYNISRVTCVLNAASKVGTPSYTFKIQGKDAASGLYYDLLTSASLTNTATANPISVGAGLTDSANVSIARPIPATWRVSATVTGTTSVTGTIGCSVQ